MRALRDLVWEKLTELQEPPPPARQAKAQDDAEQAHHEKQPPGEAPAQGAKPGSATEIPPVPETIIDLRGLITSSPREPGSRVTAFFGGSRKLFRPCFKERARPIREDGHLLAASDQKAIKQEADALSKSGRDAWYLGAIGRYWRAVQPDAGVKEKEDVEFSATGLLDGRALLITYMVAPAAAAAGGAKPSPVRFFLHCRRSDERQIGRLVDRLCTMATVRAALDRHADQVLRKRKDLRMLLGSIEKSMGGLIFQNQILNAIILRHSKEDGEAHEENATPGRTSFDDLEEALRRKQDKAGGKGTSTDYVSLGANTTHVRDQSSRDVLRAISAGMSELEGDIQAKLQSWPTAESEPDHGTDDYMEYKVERATYYFDKFSRLAEQIRVARVEGFQTYPELVQRRMQDAFSYVENVREYLREIAEQRTRMSAQIGNVTQIVEAHESDEEQRKIAEIQDFAEFALLTFLLPYYFGYMLKEVQPYFSVFGLKFKAFFALIIVFTLINLAKRYLEGKLDTPFWFPPKKGFWRRAIAAFTSINVLSVLAIVAALALTIFSSPAGSTASSSPTNEVNASASHNGSHTEAADANHQ